MKEHDHSSKSYSHADPAKELAKEPAKVPAKAVPPEITADFSEINAELVRIADLVATQTATIKAGMTAEDVTAVKSNLSTIVASLKLIGADAGTPIPPTPVMSKPN